MVPEFDNAENRRPEVVGCDATLNRLDVPAQGESRWLLAVAAIPAIIVLAILAEPILFGKTYLFSDLAIFHLPIRAFYAECLRRGDSFAWIPSIISGCYIHAEGQAGMYHPFHWLLYRWFPLTLALHCEILFSYPFLYAGMVLFLRRWGMPRFAVLFGAFTFTFSGFTLLHGMHVNMVAVLAHLPWLLWTLDLILRAPSRKTVSRASLGLGLIVASQILLGYPQAMYWSALAAGAYLLVLLPGMALKDAAVRLAHIALALVLALGLGAVQLLPTIDLWAQSDRAEPSLKFRYGYSLHPYDLFQLIGPYFYKGHTAFNPHEQQYLHEFVLYNGAASILFLAWMVIRPRRNRMTWLLPIVAVAAILLSLGRFGYVYNLLVDLPIVKSFRCPVRHAVLFQFASAVAAAIVVSDLWRAARDRQPVAWWRLSLLSVPVALGWLVTLFLWMARTIGKAWFAKAIVPGPDLYLSPSLVTLAAILMVAAARGRYVALVALMLMAMTDQAIYGLSYFRALAPDTVANVIDGIEEPPTTDGRRVLVSLNNLPILRGAANADGYLGGYPRTELLYDGQHDQALRAANVGWCFEVAASPGFIARWRKIARPCPRAYLVSQTCASRNPLDDIERTDLSTTALIAEDVKLDGGQPGELEWVEHAPGRIHLHIEAPARRLVVISEKYHPGWHATVDGNAQPVVQANGDFMGCFVEAGSHELLLRFDPASLRWGRGVSLVSGLGWLAWLALARRRAA